MSVPRDPCPESKPCRILVVEDYLILGELLAMRLADEANFEVVGVAGTAERALELLEAERPEMLLLDLGLPSPAAGLGVLQEARRLYPGLKILVFSAAATMATVYRSTMVGVNGFVEKDAPWSEFAEALRRVRAGQEYFAAGANAQLMEAFKRDARGDLLDEREVAILRHLARGQQVKTMAGALELSMPVVYQMLQAMRGKLNARTNEEMLHQAHALGYLDHAGEAPAASRPR
jgi:DNA-binding NarL/FixJ family response regulator